MTECVQTPENAPRQYALARLLLLSLTLELVWMFCALQWLLIQAAQSYSAGPILLVPSAIVLTLIITINEVAAMAFAFTFLA